MDEKQQRGVKMDEKQQMITTLLGSRHADCRVCPAFRKAGRYEATNISGASSPDGATPGRSSDCFTLN